MKALDVYSWLEIGVSPRGILPESAIARVAPRPLLIIHGKADQLIDVSQARRLFSAAREPRQLRIIPSAGHCECRAVNPASYDKLVAGWLSGALR